MHRWIHASTLAIGLTTGGMLAAYAHSWYPVECCSQNDCAPADRIETGPRGIIAVMVGNRRIEIPPGFAARSSPDNQIHICFVSSLEARVPWMPLCLFVPPQA
jgi:hypothetical protein